MSFFDVFERFCIFYFTLLALLHSEELVVYILPIGEIPGIVGIPSNDISCLFNNLQSMVAEPCKSSTIPDHQAEDTDIEEAISMSYPARYLFVLVVLLTDAQLCGSDIQKNIKRRFREKISNNALYPLLHRMCNDRLIANLSKEPKMHYYCITKIGKKVLKRFCREFKLVEKSLHDIDRDNS